MRVYWHAEFDANFPDDVIEENGDIVVFPGRNIAEAIAEILKRAGLNPLGPRHLFELGWGFHVDFKKRRIWVQLSRAEDPSVDMFVEDPAFMTRFLKSNGNKLHEFLVLLNQELNADPRFHKITWFAMRDGRQKIGSPTPFEGA